MALRKHAPKEFLVGFISGLTVSNGFSKAIGLSEMA